MVNMASRVKSPLKKMMELIIFLGYKVDILLECILVKFVKLVQKDL